MSFPETFSSLRTVAPVSFGALPCSVAVAVVVPTTNLSLDGSKLKFASAPNIPES